MPLAKVSSKSQVVLPASIRRSLGVVAGDMLEIAEEGDHIVLRKAPTSFVEELDACGSELWSGYGEELQRERDQWDR